MEIKVYDYLPEAAASIREAVFIKEQGFKTEFDGIDGLATHFLLFEEGTAVATCRIFPAEDKAYRLGRLAVLMPYRKKGFGSMLVEAAEKEAIRQGGEVLSLHAQCVAKDFYGALGYKCKGEVFNDEHCPHILMEKSLV
ncbi:MAG: GNAT family N-acetyltransferase [Clostridia bacterium]|nr:GNAT family N-acetyltransferase [Clostridia bacterium]